MSAEMLEASLLGVGTVLRLDRKGCAVNGQMTKGKQQMSTPLPPPPSPTPNITYTPQQESAWPESTAGTPPARAATCASRSAGCWTWTAC